MVWWMSSVVDVWCGGCPIFYQWCGGCLVWWMSDVVDVWCGGCLLSEDHHVVDEYFSFVFSVEVLIRKEVP